VSGRAVSLHNSRAITPGRFRTLRRSGLPPLLLLLESNTHAAAVATPRQAPLRAAHTTWLAAPGPRPRPTHWIAPSHGDGVRAQSPRRPQRGSSLGKPPRRAHALLHCWMPPVATLCASARPRNQTPADSHTAAAVPIPTVPAPFRDPAMIRPSPPKNVRVKQSLPALSGSTDHPSPYSIGIFFI